MRVGSKLESKLQMRVGSKKFLELFGQVISKKKSWSNLTVTELALRPDPVMWFICLPPKLGSKCHLWG